MRKELSAYIDSWNEITFLVKKSEKYKAKYFYLYDTEDLVEELGINYIADDNGYFKYGLRVRSKLDLHHSYIIVDDLNNTIPVYSGGVVRSSEFEAEFYYDGKLGFEYTPQMTTFRVWTPVAHSVYVELVYSDGRKEKRELFYDEKGVWSIDIEGDLDETKYVYYVKIFDKYQRTLDPYGISSDANGIYNYVIDVNKLYKMKYPKPEFSGNYTDAVIYEASIRDLTCGLENENAKTFLGLVDDDPNKGLNYIASLGVTHLQLMPIYDFGGVDDVDKDKQYNWGYNPEQYFVPCGWYSKKPDDPYSRINELLQLIDEAHQRGIRIIMDVVFNHVYDAKAFPFNNLVPGYFYRVDYFGRDTNVSGCGNDIATEKRMCSRFVIDSLKFWAEMYDISGFRFDLMGLLDIETLNNGIAEIKQIDKSMMVYGEGWNMPNTIPDAYRPHSFNHYKMPNYGFFNDKYRDIIKGSQWDNTIGICFGRGGLNYDLFHLLTGSCLHAYRFQKPSQTINYVECHDNYTVFDFASKRLNLGDEMAIKGARLALQLIAISMGVVFIHAGQEFYRTKKGVENSYNSNDKINFFDYNRRDQFNDHIKGLVDLLKIRKQYPEFRMSDPYEIEQKTKFMECLSTDNTMCYMLDGSDYKLFVIIKNNYESIEFCFGNSTMIYDTRQITNIEQNCYQLEEMGVYIIKEKK